MGDTYGDEVRFNCVEGKGELEFADVGFDSDFPQGDDADEESGGGLDLDAGDGGKLRVVFEKPDQGVGVEQMRHGYM